jgi:3-dehydroquinate synthase
VNHGEAVAIGIALDARYSVLAGLLPEGEDDRVVSLLEHLGFKIFHSGLKRRDRSGQSEIMKGLADFREHLGGELTITLLSSLGVGVEVHEIDDAKMVGAIDWLEAREGR